MPTSRARCTSASATASTCSRTASSTPLRVVRVLPRARRRRVLGGRRAHLRTTCSSRRARSPDLLARGDAAARRAAAVDGVVSNRGGVEAGRDALRRREPRARGAARRAEVRASTRRKVGVLDRAERNGSSLSQIYSSLGTFGVLAGILLLVNIFFMLADERKSELGMLRAVGLRRLVARRRVRDRGLVLRARVGGRRDVRRARARPADHGVRGAAPRPAARRATGSRCTSRSRGRACSGAS